ncbi:hypothetical protein F5B20DRAFT_241263 [Whalleya microplaca]|nr:hypothetical protein F5B20DRAFT_241263 [Whalleya microplaca]
MKFQLTCSAFLATAVASALGDSLERSTGPAATDRGTGTLSNLVPSTNISLDYIVGPNTNTHSTVGIILKPGHPAVVLEKIGAAKVTCANDTVLIAFNDTAAFQRSLREWPQQGGFVLITNHMGNCDAQHERGLYWVNSLGWNNDLMIVAAHTEKTDVASVAASINVDFSQNQAGLLPSQGFTLDNPGVNIDANVSVPANSVTFSDSPSFSVSANGVYFGNNVTFWGHLSYDVVSHQLDGLSFDIDAALDSNVALTFNFTGPRNSSDYVFSPDPVRFNVLDIPNIITIRPAFLWGIGAAVDTKDAAIVSTNISLVLPDGSIHVDFSDSNKTQITGWTPHLNSTISSTDKARVQVNPFINSTVDLELDILNGAYHLAGGVTAKTTVINEITAVLNQTRRGIAGGMIWKGNSTCNNGLNIRSSLNLAVDAFVTGSWQDVVYTTDIPIGEECYGTHKYI